MAKHKILIVEDEVLIADNISRFLTKKGFEVLDIAISFEEAVQRYRMGKPDLALLDIRLNGSKTGIDFARYLKKQNPAIPFIFLTSQSDRRNIEAVKKTYPAGYLAKPINKESLFATVEVALHRFQAQPTKTEQISLFDGTGYYKVNLLDITYLEAEHVYVKAFLKDGRFIMQRSSLSDLLDRLPSHLFVRTHRSYAVNIKAVSRWDTEQVYIGSTPILISRGRRKEVFNLLNK